MFRCEFVGSDPYITCEPFLHHHKLGPQDQFLILSSDGLYQYLSNEEAVAHVEWFLEKFPDGDPAQNLIEELLFRAAKKNGRLNFIAVLIQGSQFIWESSEPICIDSFHATLSQTNFQSIFITPLEEG